MDAVRLCRPLTTVLSLTGALTLGACTDDPGTSTDSATEATGGSSGPTTGTTPPTTSATSSSGDVPTTTTVGPTTDPTTGDTDPGTSTGDPDTGTTGDTGDTDGDAPVVVCPGAPLVAPAEGTCEISKPGTKGLLIRGTVLGPETVYEQGAVLVDAAGVIACIGCDCLDAPAAADATELACADGVISPGLINPHDHIGFAKNKPIGEGVDRYEHRHDWRKGKNGHQALSVAGGASTDAILAAELRFIMSGATSAASAGGKAGLLRNLDTGGMLEGLPISLVNSDTFPLGDNDGEQLASGCGYPSLVTTAEIDDLDAYLPHIAEGINDFARNEFLCLAKAPNDVVEPMTSMIHAIALTAADTELLPAEQARVVWSPRSNIVLYGNTAQATTLDILGVPLALGTDWVASGSMNMLRELRCADELNSKYYDNHFSDADLWKMATTHAAFAVGAEQAIGLLKPGYVADIAIFNGKANARHAAVVRAELEDVVLVLRGGTALYGDAAILGTPELGGAACEPLDVCGAAKLACVAQDTKNVSSLAKVKAAIDPTYPLFFCGTPDLEPSCVPSRPGSYTGLPAVDDADGDGVKDGDDNCPAVFNPAMLIEGGQQDAEGDGIGDACDPCPLEAGGACSHGDADDIDDDGALNGVDNCPREANPDQADADDDGHGDLCDTCDQPNPGPGTCPVTIPAIRNPADPLHPKTGSPVAVSGAYVTALRPDIGNSRGFYIQNDTDEPWNGIFVFTGATLPALKVGNKVAVSGTYEEFNGLSEISNPTVQVLDPGVVLPFAPVLLDPASLATGKPNAEPFESMLVRVGPVAITVQNSDAPMDFDEFSVTGGLRVDDQLSDGVKDAGLNNACAVGIKFGDIIGIVGFGFANSKLLPRNKADVVLGAMNLCDPFVP